MHSEKACRRKVKYTKSKAKRQVQLRKEKGKGVGSYYHCNFCKGYHVTKMNRNYISPKTWEIILNDKN